MRNSGLTPFAFGDMLVRVHADDNGEPLFIAKDVALALGYEWNGAARIAHVPDEWKLVTSVVTSFGEKDMHTLTEQGLYFFLARSDKPKALPFQKWLAGEVLPAIRKTGVYVAPSVVLPDMPDAAKRLTPLLRERVLSDALQAVRISGSTDPADVDIYFAKYCAMIASTPESGRARLPGMPFASDAEAENIRRFADECLAPCRGNRVNATDIYVAFRSWWREQFDAALPTHNRFGRVMHDVCAKIRRGGSIYYVNVAFRE